MCIFQGVSQLFLFSTTETQRTTCVMKFEANNRQYCRAPCLFALLLVIISKILAYFQISGESGESMQSNTLQNIGHLVYLHTYTLLGGINLLETA